MPPERVSGRRSPARDASSSAAGAAPALIRLACHGCGLEVPLDELRPYRCRRGEVKDNVDHVLRRRFDASAFAAESEPRALFAAAERNPFRKFRRLFYSYQIARRRGLSDAAYVEIVDRLDAAVAETDGRGFRTTPFALHDQLAVAAGLDPGNLWVKNETGNVSGSHKGRHLMAIMIWLETIRSLRRPRGTSPPLAIASCGNAALAAAVVARAADRPLEVFVPPDASPWITNRLVGLGAELTICERRASDPPGDPCYLRFVETWESGALPFTAQGKRNALAIEGGYTLAWEMVAALLAGSVALDHLVVQVGGGALGASCIEGLREARDLGLLERLPRIHTVQTAGGAPLRRAHDRLMGRLLASPGESPSASGRPADLAAESARALRIRDEHGTGSVRTEIDFAIRHKSDFMWPWETAPRSIAYGILDDETYDWVSLTEGMLETAGLPLVVSEERLKEAHRLAHEHTGIAVEPTGSAGLAGLLDLAHAGVVRPDETVAVLFTGVER